MQIRVFEGLGGEDYDCSSVGILSFHGLQLFLSGHALLEQSRIIYTQIFVSGSLVVPFKRLLEAYTQFFLLAGRKMRFIDRRCSAPTHTTPKSSTARCYLSSGAPLAGALTLHSSISVGINMVLPSHSQLQLLLLILLCVAFATPALLAHESNLFNFCFFRNQ